MQTKRVKIIYWVLTGLFAAFMLLSSIPDILCSAEAVAFMTKLGYPVYFIPFLGVAKLLGVIAILVPGFPRIKEWAYAGFFFDLIGAMYSVACTSEKAGEALFMLLPLALFTASYIFYHKKLRVSDLNG